jgi:Tol biopolymer transport system component
MNSRVVRRLVAVTSVAALGAGASAPGAPASFPGRNGRIAIVTTPGKPLDYKMSTIRPDGSHPRPMRGPKSAGFWSPDGTRFLFEGVCHAKPGCGNTGAPGPNELRTVGPDGRGLRVIHFSFPKSYPGGPTDATWSPTGRRLVYVRYFPDEGGPAALFISSARGTHERLLTTSPISFWPRWSPDGSEIAFITGNSLYALRPDGTGLRTIVACEPPRQGTAPDCVVDGFDWSPDGSQLAVAEQIPRLPVIEQKVFTVDRSGAGLRELRDGSAPFWSPDGKRIGSILRPLDRFGLPDERGGSLQISNADGSGVRTVRKGVFFADWQPLPR